MVVKMGNAQILIADDSLISLEGMKHLLSLAGYECDTASSPESAIEMLGKKPYKLAILDLRFMDDDLGGIRIANWLFDSQSQTKAVILSAYLTIGVTTDLLRSGKVLNIISKTESGKELIAHIREAMQSL